jgi:hypothetical protein
LKWSYAQTFDQTAGWVGVKSDIKINPCQRPVTNHMLNTKRMYKHTLYNTIRWSNMQHETCEAHPCGEYVFGMFGLIRNTRELTHCKHVPHCWND